MTYFINDWALKDGYVPPVMLMMSMTAGITLLGVILLSLWGKSCRRMTQNSRVHKF